jgi:hypothetical protein
MEMPKLYGTGHAYQENNFVGTWLDQERCVQLMRATQLEWHLQDSDLGCDLCSVKQCLAIVVLGLAPCALCLSILDTRIMTPQSGAAECTLLYPDALSCCLDLLCVCLVG